MDRDRVVADWLKLFRDYSWSLKRAHVETVMLAGITGHVDYTCKDPMRVQIRRILARREAMTGTK